MNRIAEMVKTHHAVFAAALQISCAMAGVPLRFAAAVRGLSATVCVIDAELH